MKTAMGIDIGGSGIKGAIVDIESGKLISERVRLPTPENAKPDAVAKVVNDLVRSLGWDGVIGCGFPAVVHHGVALTAANVHKDWIGTDVNRLLSDATGCPTFTSTMLTPPGLPKCALVWDVRMHAALSLC